MKEALAIHKFLPYETICQIFTVVAKEYGPLIVPFFGPRAPPQILLSTVCSEWRSIALTSIAELWNHVKIEWHELSDRGFQICHEWLRKAGSRPVTLEFDLHFGGEKIRGRDVVHLVQKAMSLQDLRVNKLRLRLSEQQFLDLDQLTPEVVSHLDTLELEFTPPPFELRKNAKTLPHFVGHISSLFCVEFEPENILDLLTRRFPWGRLRRLGCFFKNMTPGQVIQVLQYMPLLEELKIYYWGQPDSPDVPANPISLFHLRAINIEFYRLSPDDNLLFFECPKLKKLDINAHDVHITETNFDIISRQYNLRRLERFVFGREYKTTRPFAPFFKLSTILKEAPMLRYCSAKNSILDEDAAADIATGELGQFLEHLDVRPTSDFGVILNMLEGRLQAVQNSIQGGRRWYEEVSLLKRVGLCGRIEEGMYKRRLEALRKADIKIQMKVRVIYLDGVLQELFDQVLSAYHINQVLRLFSVP